MDAELSPTRHGVVEGRDVFVFDGLLTDADLSAYVEALARAPFTRTEVAKPETAEYKHWVSEMALANVTRLPLWAPTERALAAARPGERYQPFRAYTNYAAYGDMLYTHTDCLPDQRQITALWFLSTQWEPEWAARRCFSTRRATQCSARARSRGGLSCSTARSPTWGGRRPASATRRATPSRSSSGPCPRPEASAAASGQPTLRPLTLRPPSMRIK